MSDDEFRKMQNDVHNSVGVFMLVFVMCCAGALLLLST